MSDAGINHSPVDRYTSAHAGVGATMAWLGMPGWAAFLVSVGWEVAEDQLKTAFPESFPYASHDSLSNAITDTLAVMAGWRLADASMESATKREQLGLAAAVGCTIGALVMPVTIGMTKVRSLEDQRLAARRAYVFGTAAGAAVGSAVQLARLGTRAPLAYALQMGLAAIGGGLGGPVGAAVSGYIGGAELERSRSIP